MLRLVYLVVWINTGCGILFNTCTEAQPVHIAAENNYINAGAYGIHFTDAFSFRSNVACLGNVRDFEAGMLAERKWMLKELDSYEAALSCRLNNGGLGIALKQSGDADYSEQGLELGYGKNLGRLELGIFFSYLLDQASGYDNSSFGFSGIGLRLHVSDRLISGWELGLPVFGKAGKTVPEKAPQFFRMGFGYEWNTGLLMVLQAEKISGTPLHITASVEYRYGDQFIFSLGINGAGSPFFKSGWKKNHFSIQLYTVYDFLLGFSPGLVLLWGNKNEKR